MCKCVCVCVCVCSMHHPASFLLEREKDFLWSMNYIVRDCSSKMSVRPWCLDQSRGNSVHVFVKQLFQEQRRASSLFFRTKGRLSRGTKHSYCRHCKTHLVRIRETRIYVWRFGFLVCMRQFLAVHSEDRMLSILPWDSLSAFVLLS